MFKELRGMVAVGWFLLQNDSVLLFLNVVFQWLSCV